MKDIKLSFARMFFPTYPIKKLIAVGAFPITDVTYKDLPDSFKHNAKAEWDKEGNLIKFKGYDIEDSGDTLVATYIGLDDALKEYVVELYFDSEQVPFKTLFDGIETFHYVAVANNQTMVSSITPSEKRIHVSVYDAEGNVVYITEAPVIVAE